MFEAIPQVQKILEEEVIRQYVDQIGHPFVVDVIRHTLAEERKKVAQGIPFDYTRCLETIVQSCEAIRLEKLQRVINGTGVLLHTNLGRAPLGITVMQNLIEQLKAYCNLEYHLPTQKRGKRGGFVERLLCMLTGAEDAVIVNNNAASVFLILHHFAKGKEVVISRGELIQIGGGFRIPDIMQQAGCTLVEVGTTNITELHDYVKAITQNTTVILSAHRSNFYMKGFTSFPSLQQLSTLRSSNVILVKDLGSGNLVLPDEDNVANAVKYADIVCFSGDKMLGACQAGIILGKKHLIQELKVDPLMRVLRVDKITYFILQEVLLQYANNRHTSVLLWDCMNQDIALLRKRIKKLFALLRPVVKPFVQCVTAEATLGGGAMPEKVIPDVGITIAIEGKTAEQIASHMVSQPIPIVGYIQDGMYRLNFRTIFDSDIHYIAHAINTLLP